MKDSSSESSFAGDESTVSSRNSRNRILSPNGIKRLQQQEEAVFDDMPSLASYRADEISIASTAWTDCDNQSLPSLSSYRTKDLSLSSHHSRKRISPRLVGKPKFRPDELGMGKPQSFPLSEISRLSTTTTKVHTLESELAASVMTADFQPKLPRRSSLLTEGEDESDISDESSDVSIATVSENGAEVKPMGEFLKVSPIKKSPKPKGNKSSRPQPRPKKIKSPKKSETDKPLRSPKATSQPVVIEEPDKSATPPLANHSRKKAVTEKNKAKEPSVSRSPEKPRSSYKIIRAPAKIRDSPKPRERGREIRNPQRSPRRRRTRSADLSNPLESEKNVGIRRSLRRTRSEHGKLPRKKHEEKRGRGLRRSRSSDVSTQQMEKKEGVKRGTLMRRLSSSLSQMVQRKSRSPTRTMSRRGSGVGTSLREFATGTASKLRRGKRPEKHKGDQPVRV